MLLDVDGVLTDGIIALDDNGVETKHFHVRDGAAVSLWRRAGRRAAILSGRFAPAVDRRAAELGIAPVLQGAASKLDPFRDLLRDLGLEPHQVAYMGDDLPDLPVLAHVGLAACPADAAVAQRLGVTKGTALLAVERVVYDSDDRPVQWLQGLYRPDRYQYEMQLSRVGGIDAKVWVSTELSAQFH